jgi:hypothetical protein
MADIINPSSTGMTHNADVYWHYAGDPVQRSQLLGTFTIGAPQKVLLPIPADADIVLRCVPRGGRGQGFMAGPGDATPYTISALGVGTGGGTSNFYQGLRVNHGYSSGYTPTPRPILNLLNAFQVKDDSLYGESDLSTFGVPTGLLNLRTDCNASGQIAVTTLVSFNMSGTVTVAATLELQPGMGILVAGAGISGGNLIGTVGSVSADGKTYVLTAALASTPTLGALVQADDTVAVQTWINGGSTSGAGAAGDLVMPPGYYRLTSSIILPTTSEGFSVIIHGSGWDLSVFAFQHTGDGFVSTSDLKIDSMVFTDLTISTGTIGDASGTINPANHGIGVRMTAPSYTGIYNNLVMQRCRIIGWGRFGLWSDNLEVSWISQCIFRENKSGHVAFVGPDTISPNKQPNANTITDTTFDQAISAGPSDVKHDFTGSMFATSRNLTVTSGYSFTSADRGKFVIVLGAATIGGDLYTFIDSVTSSSVVVLAHQAQLNSSGAVHLFPVNVASILLNRANDTVLDGSTIQGNFADAGSGATNVLSDVNAIKVYNSDNCRFIGIHEEDNAGPGGAAIRMENCHAITIENWGGTSAGPPNFDNAHGADFQFLNCHCVRVSQCFFNDRPQFLLDGNCSEIEIDNSLVVGYINLWQQDNSWDKLKIGSGVRIYQAADPRTNQVAGNEYSYDSMFGRDLITNGRFIDGAGGNEGWTTTNPSWWLNPATAITRFGSYIRVDATGIAASTTAQPIFHQSVPIPDSLPNGLFTLAFDWYLEAQLGVETTGYFVEVRAHPSIGIDEVVQFSTRRFSVVTGAWQNGQLRCFLGAGTGRTIDVQINVTPGPNNVKIRFTNFRLAPGKHIFGSWERAVHDFGGRMHAPLEFAHIATSGTGSTAPPPTGATYMSMVNDAGTLKIGYNNAWTTVGTGGSGTGVAAGTPNFFTMYNSSGTNIVNAPMDVEFGWVHFRTGGWLDPTQPLFSNYPSGFDAKFCLLDTDNVVYIGPDHDTAGGHTGSNLTLRAGCGNTGTSSTSYKSTLQITGATGLFTLNNFRSANTTDTLRVTLPDLSMDGVVVQQPPGTTGMLYLGSPFAYRDLAGATTFFGVDHNGGINFINSRQYTWPSTTGIVTGGLPMVLAYTSQAAANNPVTLSWIPMSGGTGGVSGSGTVNFLPKYTGTSSPTSTVGDSGFTDDGNLAGVVCNQFIVRHRSSVDDLSEVSWQTPVGANFAIWRYDHRTGALTDGANTDGEMVLLINDNTPRIAFGRHSSYFTMGLRVRPGTGGAPMFVGENNVGTAIFRVDLNGNLGLIQSLGYTWPITTPVVTGGLPMVLAYTAQTVVNQPVTLSWIQMAGGTGGGISTIGPNVVNVLTKWSSSPGVSVRDSGITDDGSTVISLANLFAIRSRANDFADLYWQGISGTNQAIWRYQHASASLADPSANSASGWGEMQLFMQTQTVPSFFVGNAHSWFQSALRVRPFSGYSTDLYSFESWAPGASSANFRVKTDGDLSMIKSVAYIWPGAPTASGQVLTVSNFTTGALAWQAPTGGGVTWNSGTTGPVAGVLTKWTPGTAPYTIQNSSITDNGIQVTVANPFKISISSVDKFTVSNIGAVFAAGSIWSNGGQKFSSVNFQPAAGTYTLDVSWRTVSLDAVNGNLTINLPYNATIASGAPGQIWDLYHLRAIIGGTGISNTITINAPSGDNFFYYNKATSVGVIATTYVMQNADQRRAIKLIACDDGAGTHFWVILPYNM